ncbi:MAG: PKD domain-containing protein [Bacteroidota bacterium]
MKHLKFMKIWSLLLAALLITFSCDLEEDQVVGEPPVADAGRDIDAFVGSTVTLNGSNSSDPEGGSLIFNWELTTSPSESSVNISNASNEEASFVPDEPGDYTATLTVEDEDGNTDSDDVVISVTVNDNEAPEAIITDTNNEMIAPENDNNVVNVGNTIQLSGANSSDPEGDDLTYLWEVTSTPDNSTPTLENEETVTLDFVADVEGEYTIQLTVDDGNGNESTAEVTITAEVSPVIIDSNITSDRTLENLYDNSDVADYHITNSISIEAILTIDPGVKIILDEDVNVFVSSSGTIISNGEDANHVEFTSSNTDGGILWKGIEIVSTSSQNAFNYTDFSYAGRSEYGGFSNFVDVESTIAVRDDGKFSLTNSSISNSGGYGIYMRYGEIIDFQNNDFSDNSFAGVGLNVNQAVKIDGASTFANNQHAVEIYGSTFDESGEPSLAALDNSNKYYVSGDLDITSLLNVDEGAKFEMAEDVNIKISSGGVLSAIGTENNKIEFTTANLDAGLLWKGFEFLSGDSRNELTHCIVSYAGNSEYGGFSNFVDVEASIAMRDDTKLTLTNTEVSNSGGYGVYSRYGEFVDFSSNSFIDNGFDHLGLPANEVGNIDEATTFTGGDEYAVEVYNGGDLSVESTWVNLAGDARYNIVSQITVVAGLTINPGAEIDLDEDVDIDVRDTGYLVAEGTSDQNIVFTSSNEAGQIAWGGIKFYTGDARNSLDFVTINLAGGNVTSDLNDFVDEKTAVAGDNSAKLSLTNSTISNSEGYGVYFQGDINDIEGGTANNTFTDNTNGNVY